MMPAGGSMAGADFCLVKSAIPTKAVREEDGNAAIGAAGDELKLTGNINTIIKGHGAQE